MPETKIKKLLAKLRHGLEHLYGERLSGIYLAFRCPGVRGFLRPVYGALPGRIGKRRSNA